MATSPVAVVDLGGTKIHTLLVDADGAVLAEDRRPTNAAHGAGAMLQAIGDSIATVSNAATPAAIGIAAAGTIDAATGAADSVNLPNWRGLPIVGPLEARFGCRVLLENDGNAAAWGEYTLGAGRGSRHMVYLALGTGVGGGLVIDERLVRGRDGAAGELGHIPLDPTGPVCGCGSAGCLEQFASGTALGRAGELIVRAGRSSRLAELAGDGPVTAELVHHAAVEGDPACIEAIRTAGVWLGRGIVALVNVINPDRVVIGGGLAKIGPLLLDPARDEVRQRAMRPAGASVELLPSLLGDRAAPLGLGALLHRTDRALDAEKPV